MSHKDNEYQRRLFLLSGAHISVILSVTLPLLFYSSLTLVFSFFDTFTAANMNANVLTTVSFASDIRNMLNAISWGLSVGVGVMISRSFGNGDMEQVKTEMSTVFFLALFIAVSLLIVVIPFSRPILRLVAFPEELLSSGAFFLSIEVVTLVFSFINSIFFTTEKARGRTKIVMYGNLIVLGIKTLLNFVIIALVSSGTLSSDIAMYLLPVASGIAFGSISIYALKRMFSKKNIFRISFKSACFRKKMLLPFAKLSFPVIIEKVMIPFGKVICNSLFIGFGTVGVAAFSCSQRILSLTTSPLNSFKDAESTIISTNLGNRDTKRALSFLFYSCLVTFAAGIILFIVVALSSEFLIGFFAKGNADLAIKMRNIYLVERWDFLFCALDGSMCGLLYALKKTKLPTIVNIVKLFCIRIPLFLLLTRYFAFGIEAIAWAILVTNAIAAIASMVFVIFAVKDYKKKSEIEQSNNEMLSTAVVALGKWDSFDEKTVGREGIHVPVEVLEAMCLKYNGTLSNYEMTTIYKEAVVEARIEALEKEEALQER